MPFGGCTNCRTSFRRFVKNSLFGSAQKLLDGLVQQDVLMIEEEQRAYLQNPQQRGYEFNRTLASVQRLIRAQADSIGVDSR
jgi:hypothetical protein